MDGVEQKTVRDWRRTVCIGKADRVELRGLLSGFGPWERAEKSWREDFQCMCRVFVGMCSPRYVFEGGKDGELRVETLRGERTSGAMETLGAVGSWLEDCEEVRRGYEGQS